MLFFSGFSLQNAEYLFSEYLSQSDYSLSGFSYGAIKAFKRAKELLDSGKRVDRLQLISPAFFQTKSSKFKRLQMLAYSKNEQEYMKQFIDACFYPYEKKIIEYKKTTSEELDELLNYEWNLEELQKLVDRGLKLEVYLGSEDKIIDIESAREYFLQVASLTYVKDANHFLQTN